MRTSSRLLIIIALSTITFSCKKNSKPILKLNGSSNYTISLNSIYIEPGATADDGEGNDISSEIIITGTVNTNLKGEYPLYYKIGNDFGSENSKVIRNVNVVNDADYLEGFYLATPNCGATSLTGYTTNLTSSETENNKILIDVVETGTPINIPGFINNNTIFLSNQGTIYNFQYTGSGTITSSGFILNSVYTNHPTYGYLDCQTVYTKQ